MDVLLNILGQNGVGCHIGNTFHGTFGYADDLALICPSVKGLQNMLSICEDYDKEFDVKFNAKTVCMFFN